MEAGVIEIILRQRGAEDVILQHRAVSESARMMGNNIALAGAAGNESIDSVVSPVTRVNDGMDLGIRHSSMLALNFVRMGQSGSLSVSGVAHELLLMNMIMGDAGAAALATFAGIGTVAIATGYYIKRDAEMLKEIQATWKDAGVEAQSYFDIIAMALGAPIPSINKERPGVREILTGVEGRDKERAEKAIAAYTHKVTSEEIVVQKVADRDAKMREALFDLEHEKQALVNQQREVNKGPVGGELSVTVEDEKIAAINRQIEATRNLYKISDDEMKKWVVSAEEEVHALEKWNLEFEKITAYRSEREQAREFFAAGDRAPLENLANAMESLNSAGPQMAQMAEKGSVEEYKLSAEYQAGEEQRQIGNKQIQVLEAILEELRTPHSGMDNSQPFGSGSIYHHHAGPRGGGT